MSKLDFTKLRNICASENTTKALKRITEWDETFLNQIGKGKV